MGWVCCKDQMRKDKQSLSPGGGGGASLWLISITICITVIANTKDWLEASQIGMMSVPQ